MSTCPACGAVLTCGMVDANASNPCWCTTLPSLPAAAQAALNRGQASSDIRCFCPDCLRKHIAASIDAAAPASQG